jgi:hypothetical protein
MSRYNNTKSQSNDNNNDFDDDVEIKLKEYSTIRFTPTSVTGNLHDQFGESFIQSYEDLEILDGIVLRRDDKPMTWNVYSADKFFNLNPEDGLVYENYDDENGYTGQMSAQDILEHPRVAGHSTSAGGNDYYFTPIGVVIEEAEDIAVADDAEVEVGDAPSIVAGDASMLLGNNAWVRTFAKLMTEEGDSIINDNGKMPTDRGEPEVNPKYDGFDWMTTTEPTIREDLEGRELDLFVTREQADFDDGDQTYLTPNLMDVSTGEFINIDNDESGDVDSGQQAKATDGGTTTADTSDTSSTESPDEPSTASNDDGGLPENVPDKLDDLIDYMARNGDTTPDEIRSFAEDEVEDVEAVDWEAAANEANQRAE